MKFRSNPFYLILGLVLLVGTGLGYLVWNYISLPFSNPMEVVGPPTLHGINPYNDILRFIIFVLLPSGLLLILYVFNLFGIKEPIPNFSQAREGAKNKKNTYFFEILLILFAALLSLNIPTYHSFGQFDPFHEGESLGTAMSAIDHQVPYRDYFFFHGVIQDPLRSVWAFQWFGQSIGAQRTLESIFKVATWMLLALFLAKVFFSNRFFALAALISIAVFSIPFLFDTLVEPWVRPHEPENIVGVFKHCEPWLAPFHWIILSGRDLLSMAFLLAFLSVLKYTDDNQPSKNNLKLSFSAFCFSFFPLMALAHSVDRGIYLMTAGCVFSAWFVLFFLKRRESLFAYIAGILFGWISGILALGYFLQWNYAGFVSFVFGVLPRYKLLTDALPYPIQDPRYFVAMVLLAFYVFREWERFLRLIYHGKLTLIEALKVFLGEDGVLVVLLTLSLFNFRNVLERPVLDHLAYNFIFVFLMVLVDIFRTFRPFFESRLFQKISLGILAFVVILAGFSFYRLMAFDQWGQNFPLKKNDVSFLTDNRRQVVDFLKTELKTGEPFFALTNDASWYYLLNRPSPTAYPCLWVAAPKAFQQQVVESLEQKKIRIVLYKNSFWGSSIDDIPDLQRFPVITQYVQSHYIPYKKIADQEIWIRKN